MPDYRRGRDADLGTASSIVAAVKAEIMQELRAEIRAMQTEKPVVNVTTPTPNVNVAAPPPANVRVDAPHVTVDVPEHETNVNMDLGPVVSELREVQKILRTLLGEVSKPTVRDVQRDAGGNIDKVVERRGNA